MSRFAAIMILFGAALACSDNSPGILKVNLTTPNGGADKAILLTVNGPGKLVSAAPGSGLRLFSQSLSTTSKVALTGTLASGTILTIEVPDISKSSQYTATILQVATPAYQLRSLTGYSLKVVP